MGWGGGDLDADSWNPKPGLLIARKESGLKYLRVESQ